jgi:hypothetical protein
MKGAHPQDRKQKSKKQDLQVLAPYPGCLGRVINMFDLSNGVVATKMLTEKAHRDGMLLSPLFCVVHVVSCAPLYAVFGSDDL